MWTVSYGCYTATPLRRAGSQHGGPVRVLKARERPPIGARSLGTPPSQGRKPPGRQHRRGHTLTPRCVLEHCLLERVNFTNACLAKGCAVLATGAVVRPCYKRSVCSCVLVIMGARVYGIALDALEMWAGA